MSLRLRSDVKIATYLSSGIDSNAVLFTSKKITKRKMNTFSIFNIKSKRYDESEKIKKIVKKYKFKNYNIDAKNVNFVNYLKEMITYYNSPVLTLNNLLQSLCVKKLIKEKQK